MFKYLSQISFYVFTLKVINIFFKFYLYHLLNHRKRKYVQITVLCEHNRMNC